MLHKRYASPFSFLDTLIVNKTLSEGLQTLFEKIEEERLFEIYKAHLSNPFAELPSFDEWKKQIYKPQEQGLTQQEVNTAVEQAQNTLNNFVPQK